MSPALDTSVQQRLTPQVTSSNRSQHKRKRDEAGDSEARAHNEKKRSKIRRSSMGNPKNSQAQNAVVVKSVPKVEREKNYDYSIESKATKLSVVSQTKLAKRERRKAKRGQESTSHNREGEEKNPNGTSSSSGQDAGSQRAVDQRPTARNKKHKENGNQSEAAPTWTLSEPGGGRFVHSEPLFSADEK